MNLRKLFTLGSIASAAPLVEFASRFARTIILSHFLSPAEFGIGATLAVLIGLAELSTDLGLDRFLILRARQDDAAVLAAVHRMSVIRGVILATIVFIAAPRIADFLGSPDQDWSFRIVAGVILLRSFTNLEMKQIQRDLRYGRDAMAYVAAHLIALAAVYPALLWFGDHRAVIVILFVECGIYVAVSHATAHHRFDLRAAPGDITRAALIYGLPLSLNGIGLAIMGQFDRAVVSHSFGVETLAFYAILLNLTVTPISAIYRVMGQLGMSFLARGRTRGHAPQQHETLVWGYTLVAGAYALGIAALADIVAPWAFGAVYAVPPLFHVLVTAVVWVRLCRGAQTIMLLAAGRTQQLMIANLAAGLWVPLAFVALPFWPRPETVLAAVLFGDVFSFAVFIWGTRQDVANGPSSVFYPLSWSCAALAVACLSIGVGQWEGYAVRYALVLFSGAILATQAGYGLRYHLLPIRETADSI